MDIEELRPWLVVIERDLRAARNCLFGPEPTEEVACYHCQQAAEKLVKVTLVHAECEVPFSHDIRALVALVPMQHPLRNHLVPLARFTPFATAYRYPMDDPLGVPPTPCREEVVKWVEAIAATKVLFERSLELPEDRE